MNLAVRLAYMKENFDFETDRNAVVFSELIVSRMISLFGISRDEAMGARDETPTLSLIEL